MMDRIVTILFLFISKTYSSPKSSSSGNDSKVYGGSYASRGVFPWHIYLDLGGSSCGASLVGPDLALTACHCVSYEGYMPLAMRPVEKVYGIMGVVDLFADSAEKQVRYAHSLVAHPRCAWNVLYGIPVSNDAGAVYFQAPFVITPTVRIIPTITMDGWDLFQYPQGAQINCYLSGFGVPSPEDQAGSQFMKQLPSFIPSETECGLYLGCAPQDAACVKTITIENGMTCSGPRIQGSSSSGDSGGPYSCEIDGTWLLVGIVSAGPIMGTTDMTLIASPRAFLSVLADAIAMSCGCYMKACHILLIFSIVSNSIKASPS